MTIFIDKDNNYIFKTFNERLQSGVIDWTDKYKERNIETYTPKNYAQVNYFRHKYNDENANYNNGNFLIDNKNLKDNTDVLSSFTYSPEKDIESFFINNSFKENIYPTLLWEKEISENTGLQKIKYNSLSNRFYFLRLENITQNSILKSETLLVEQSITSFPAARFYMTLYKDFVPKYYSNIRLLLNDFRLHKMKINLGCIDIHNLDFDKIYYFYQEKNYYFINKINYENGKISNAEMYRVKYSETDNVVYDSFITNVTSECVYFTLSNTYTNNLVELEWSLDNGMNWFRIPVSAISPVCSLNYNQNRLIRLKDHDTLQVITPIYIYTI